MITFNEWQGSEAVLGSTAYTLMDPFNPAQHETGKVMSVMQENLFHFISNRPEQYLINDYFFVLEGKDVVSVHAEETNTSDGFDVHIGTPSMKYTQGFGYDKDHIIQLATMTLPRARKSYGENVVLGDPQTYEVVISRDITASGDPFTYKDNIYATKQTSGTSFFYFSHYAMSYLSKSDGVSAFSKSF